MVASPEPSRSELLAESQELRAEVAHRETTIATVLAADATHAPEPPEVPAARRALRDLPVELDRVLAAIRAGMDPEPAVITTKQIQRDLAAAESKYRHAA